MPDYPYIYDTDGARPPGGRSTLLRVFPRKRRKGDDGALADDRGDDPSRESEASWRLLLEQAVVDLNSSFRQAGIPFSCTLEEDRAGFCLRVLRLTGEGSPGTSSIEEVEEEALTPADLGRWLIRLRSRLGILVDETA